MRWLKREILRVRSWLIKKLGGYTEQTVMQPARYNMVPVHPERVVCHASFNPRIFGWQEPDPEMERKYAERTKEELVYMCVKKIVDEGYGVLTCEPGRRDLPGERVYTMTLCVLPPREWLKTDLGYCVDPGMRR